MKKSELEEVIKKKDIEIKGLKVDAISLENEVLYLKDLIAECKKVSTKMSIDDAESKKLIKKLESLSDTECISDNLRERVVDAEHRVSHLEHSIVELLLKFTNRGC